MANRIDSGALALIHADSSAALDYSNGDVSLTNSGATVSTEQAKFGDGALYFSGSSSLTLTSSSGTATTVGTVEFWLYVTTVSSDTPMGFLTVADSSGITGLGLYYSSSKGTVTIRYSKAAGDSTSFFYGSGTVALGQWNHICLCFDSSTSVKVYLNGVYDYTLTLNGTFDLSQSLRFGLDTGSQYNSVRLTGYLDEIYLSTEVNHTGDFTPPTKAYTTTAPLYVNKDGVWIFCTAVYQKQESGWVEQDDPETLLAGMYAGGKTLTIGELT